MYPSIFRHMEGYICIYYGPLTWNMPPEVDSSYHIKSTLDIC